MKVLTVSALFPPNTIGGAEISAFNLASWLRRAGHEVGVLTTARSKAERVEDEMIDGLRTWRIDPPRPYRVANHHNAKTWQKPVWHLQDHVDPRNRKAFVRVLDTFQPDFVNIHLLPGIGFNILEDLAARDIPVLYVLPDLGLACIRSSMFRNGHECSRQCTACVLSSKYKLAKIRKVRRIGFYSPSAANLSTISAYFPISEFPNRVLLNPNDYPLPTVGGSHRDHVRFVYVGRLHETKGIDVLLEAAELLANTHEFTMHVVGGGPSEEKLRRRFGNHPWIEFSGRVSQQEVSNALAAADVLCIPSIWAENSPGVVINALGRSLAVLGSNKGGIPELVEHERNGMLLPAGDIQAWRAAMGRAIDEPEVLAAWRNSANNNSYRFDPEYLGAQIYSFMTSIAKNDVENLNRSRDQ